MASMMTHSFPAAVLGLFRRPTATPVMAGILALASIAGCAVAGPYNPGNLPADQLAQVGGLCQSVIGLQPGEAHYVGCVESLSDSLRGLGHSRAVARAHGDCLDRGLKPDTPELAECVLRSAETTPSQAPHLAVRPVSESQEQGSAKSYFRTSRRDVRRREELSCARLGLEPGTGGFAGCVAGLQATLFAADNPMN